MTSPRPPVLPPARSWEVMAALREALGLAGMQRIFSVGHNQIGRYCRNPDISDDAERNPLDRVRLLLARGVEAGAEEAVRMAVGYLLEPLGMKAVPVGEAPPDRETCEAECLDDYPTLLRLHEAVRTLEGRHPAHPRTVAALMEDHMRECEQTCAKYRTEWVRLHGDTSSREGRG